MYQLSKLKIFVFILVLVFYGSLLIHKISTSTDDIGRHIQNGKMIMERNLKVLTTNVYSYTEPDFPYVNDHWLSSVVFYFLHALLGFKGLVIVKTVILLSLFSLIFWVSMRKADFWLVAALSIPTILILRERTDLRPEIFSYFFTVLFLYFLLDLTEHPERKRIFWLVPLQFLWANFHLYFFVGVVLVSGLLFEKIILNFKAFWRDAAVKKLLMILPVLAAVSFINPNGARGALNFLYKLDYFVQVDETAPLFRFFKSRPVEDISIIIFIPMTVLLFAGFILYFRKKHESTGDSLSNAIFYFLASAGTAAAGFFMVRNLPFFGLIFLPVASRNFNGIFLKSKYWLNRKSPKTAAILKNVFIFILIAAISFLIFLGARGEISKKNEPGLGLVSYSNGAATFFKEHNLQGPILNDHAIGSYLIYHFFPQEKVFFDNRGADSYSKDFIYSTNLQMLTREDKWLEMLEKYNFNAIFFNHRDMAFGARNFLRRRLWDPDWSLVYADNSVVILLRNNPENQKIIEEFQITRENVGEKMSYLLESENIDDHSSAADFFNLMGKEDLAFATFQEVVLKQQKNSRVWWVMGEMAVRKNSEKSDILAVIYLERALALGRKNADVYTWLGLAYFRLSRFEEAERTLKKALKIDPDREDTKNYLAQLKKYLKK